MQIPMTQQRQDVLDKVGGFIASICPTAIAAGEVSMETKLADIADFDSLDRAELLMMVEEKWRIYLPDFEASKISTVGELVDVICRKAF